MQYLTDHDLTGERGAHQRLRLQVPTLARVGSQPADGGFHNAEPVDG
jgi:hypothetical protein